MRLADEPIILTVPDIMDRYWSVEVADVYTNNLFYIGTRTTGAKGGNHAFVGPNWKGQPPKDVIEHRVPSFVPEAPYHLPASALRLKSPWGGLFPQRTAPGAKEKQRACFTGGGDRDTSATFFPAA